MPRQAMRTPLVRRTYLRGDLFFPDGTAPDRFARPPVRGYGERFAAVYRNRRIQRALTGHRSRQIIVAQAHGPFAAICGPSRPETTRQPAEPFAADQFDRSRNRSQHCLLVGIRLDRMKTIRILLRNETGRQPSFAPARMAHQRGQERHVVLDAVDDETVERIRHRVDRLLPRRCEGAEFCDHRIVEYRNLRSLGDARIVAHDRVAETPLLRRPVARQPADRRQEVAVRVLSVEPAFHRPAVQLHVVLPDRQLLARRDADHLLDEVDAGHEFGYRMLDLQPGVHLEEIEVAVLVDDELDRAGALVIDGLRQRHRLPAHGAARLLVDERRRRLLHDLLVAPLDRAFAFAEMDAVAVSRRRAPGFRCAWDRR